MSVLRTIRNYFFYCGIEKDEYDALKKDAYVSNYRVWRVLHFVMSFGFAVMFVSSLLTDLTRINRWLYLSLFFYSIAANCLFYVLKKDSIFAQFLIYVSICVLFLFGCAITRNHPDMPAVSFVVFLLITPMFMIDKPYFMTLVLLIASGVFLVWMRGVKPPEVWRTDCGNVIAFMFVGIFLHIIANAIRIREFVLTRTINIQKDTDELTGLKNKSALTREINAYLADGSNNRGTMFLLDIDRFKAINDTYGHDVGDSVIRQFGSFLGSRFTAGEIAGRFGGDEFIVFLRGSSDPDAARRIAGEIVSGAAREVRIPNSGEPIRVSIGIALCHGGEQNYSEIFKRADTAMYAAKADPERHFHVYE